MSSLSLYQMEKEWQQVFELLDDPEIPNQAVLDTIELIEVDMVEKAEHYAQFIRSLEAEAKVIDGEINRLMDRREARMKRADALKSNLENMLRMTGMRQIKTPLFSFTIQKNGGLQPLVIQEELTPPEFRKVGGPDCEKIRSALDAGQPLTFAAYGERGESLRIR